MASQLGPSRRTATGISAVLYFKVYLGTWRPDVQCQINYPDGVAEAVESAAVHGRSLDLNWTNGTCFPQPGGPITDLVRRVIVTESPTVVTVSLVTYQNPAEIAAEASQMAVALPPGQAYACAGVGLADHAKVTLTAPLGPHPAGREHRAAGRGPAQRHVRQAAALTAAEQASVSPAGTHR